ncbi:TPA: hypothetical protein BOS_26334 [Bos taurus]|nr:TPA: hypothetical protein BOS_26334 [Bos taurus]
MRAAVISRASSGGRIVSVFTVPEGGPPQLFPTPSRGQCATLAHKQFCAVTVFILNFIARLLVLAPPAAAECGMLCIAQENCIVLSVGEDSDDDDDDDDVDVVLIQNFDTDFTENSSDEEVLLLLTDSEDDSDIPEELPVFSHDMEDFEALNSQIVSCLAILKGGNPDSEEVESVPLCKKARLSIPEDDHMTLCYLSQCNKPVSLILDHALELLGGLSPSDEFLYQQNLQELTEIINSQINRLRELVSEIRRSLETPQMPPCGDDNPSLPAERQENDAETNPGGTSLQSAASPERQQLECPESPPLPVIVCACSLQPNHESGSPETRRFYLSLFNEGDESANNDLSSAQDSLAQPTAHLPQAESSLHDNFETVRDSAINNNMNPDTALPSLCIPPNFETPGEAETSLASSTKIMHYPTLLENVRGQDTVSSDVIPPNFETPGEAETSLASSTKIMHYPTLLENVRGQDTVSSDVIPPNFETPGEAETSLASSTKIMHYPTLLENVRGQDTVSSDVIPPNFETPGEAETSLASSTKIMHYPTLLENVRGQDTVSSDVIPPNFETPGEAETSLASSTKIMHYPTLLENVRGQDTVSSDVIPPNFELMIDSYFLKHSKNVFTVTMPEVAETSLENKPETMSYSISGNDSGPSSSSVNLPPNFGVEKFILTQKPIKEETGVENSSQTVYYPALLGSITGLGTDFSSHSAPPNFAIEKVVLTEMPGQAETTMDNSYQTVGNETVVGNETIVRKETVVGNDSDPDMGSSHLSILPSVEMSLKVETSQENDTPVMNQPPLLEYNRDEDASYVLIPSNFESSTEMSSEAENHGSVIKIDSDQQTDSEPCFLTPGFEYAIETSFLFALVPVKILVTEENSTENRPETMSHPIVLEDDNSQASSSSSVLMPSNFGYLGDPRRNVTMSDTHLMAVQKKAIPRHAACYLVRILFSKEILTSTSVGISSQGCQSLDPNKIAAIREHLAAVFPNYDLSEHGEEWQACISSVNSLICNLSSRILKTVDKNGGPTKHKRDSNDERDGDDGASSFQVSQPEAISETREHGNSPQNSRAFPEGIQEPSTDGTAVSSETLEYLGDPRRNIQMPKSLLMTAKEKSRPDLSARYLILSLFTEEVLINSVHGSTEFGVYSLNANKINALREFLQEIYPTCDLSENGYDWKLCVMAINSCIYSLRCNLEWPTYEIQLLPPTAPSTESKPKDPDLAD